MVHHPPFFRHFLHAFYDLNTDKAVGEHKSEEDAFGFQIVLLVLNRLFAVAVPSAHAPFAGCALPLTCRVPL